MTNITRDIMNIGVDDYDVDIFENQYALKNGMAYNSYLVLDEKTAILDSCDVTVKDQWLANLKEALGDRKLDYIVIHHMEPDHSGSLSALAQEYPDITYVGSQKTFGMLKQFTDIDTKGREIVMTEGGELELGRHTLKFFMAPMVHWPEVMVSYDGLEQILFSADAFGRFGTKDADIDWDDEARRYYINIVGKYGAQVQMLLKKLNGVPVKKICSLHGPVLEDNLEHYLELYDKWSKYEPETRGVLIACASIYGNTMSAAKEMEKILKSKGCCDVKLDDLCGGDIHEAVSDAFRYDRVILAAPTYDGGIFPPMDRYLSILKDKNFQKRRVYIIENGTWGPVSGRLMKAKLAEMKNLEVAEEMVTVRSSLKPEQIADLENMAEAVLS